jgi:hypothetical protein
VLAASNLSQLATGIKVEIGSAKGAGSPGILPAGKEPAGKSEGEME